MADDINSYWFPHPDILRLAYQRNRSRFHGIDHVLRVWIYAMYIGRSYYADKIDLDVLSAASLFHDIGRRNDLKDPKHGIRSATWVNEILPALAPELLDSQIEMIKVLCRLHNLPDSDLSSLELRILKDADALDRYRLPTGKIKADYIRLPETHELIEFAKEFHADWRSIRQEEKDPFNIMIITLRDSDRLSNLLPSQVKSRTEVQITRRYLNRYLNNVESTLTDLDSSSKNLIHRLNKGTLRFKDLRTIKRRLELLVEQTKDSPSPVLHELFVQAARTSISQNMRLGLTDQTIHFALKGLYRKLYDNVSKEPRCEFEIPNSDLYQLISVEAMIPHRHVQRAVVEHLAYCREFQKLIMLLAFTDLQSKRLFLESFGRRYRLYQRLRFSFPEDQVSWQKWLWVVAVERWIRSAVRLLDDGDTDRAKHMLDYILKFIEQILEKIELTLPQLTEIISYLNDLAEIDEKHDELDLEVCRCSRLWQQDFGTLGGMNEFPGALVNQNLDIFNLYDGNSLNSSRHLIELERYLLRCSKRGEKIDLVVRNYLLPSHMNLELKYSISQEILSELKDTKIKDLVLKHTATSLQEKNIHDIALIMRKENSEQNLRRVLEPSKYRALVKTKKNYKIMSYISDLSILEGIIKNGSTILSMWNILSYKDRSFIIKHSYGTNYNRRTKYRGVLQRHMLIRRPNILNDHVYYGALQNLDDIFADPGILGHIPSPTDLFTSYRYGSVVLVFKDEIVERTLFVLLDSFWEHRSYPMAYEEAKYLYEKLRDNPIRTSLETNPVSIINSYVEANILKGVSLADVEMVLLPVKDLKRKHRIIQMVNAQYPDIEFRGI